MSLAKLFNRIFFHNNTTPALNEDNLNAMSKAIDDIDDRVIGLAGTIMEDVPQIQEDIEDLQEAEATFNAAIQSAQDAATNAQNSANAAAGSVTSAQQKALIAEGWAKGTQNGSPVSQSSPYWENNAEYWAGKARSFTPEGYQDLVDDVDDLKQTFTKNGAHNLLPMSLARIKALNTSGTWSGNTYTNQGVSFTVDIDANGSVTSITANGASTGSYSGIMVANFVPPTDHYIKTGCPSGGSENTYVFGGSSGNDTGNGRDYYSDGSSTKTYVIAIVSGYTANNLVFKPMLRLASDTDSTFAPYAMTNRELTQALGGFKVALIEDNAPTTANTYETYNIATELGLTNNPSYFSILSCEFYNSGNSLWYGGSIDVTSTGRYVSKAVSDGGNAFRVQVDNTAYTKFRAVVIYKI